MCYQMTRLWMFTNIFLQEWHIKIIEKVSKSRNASVGSKHANSFKNDVEVFPGFRPAVEASYLTWESYPIYGVTYSEASKAYHCPFMCFRHSDGHSRSGDTGLIHSSHAVLNNPAGEHHLLHSSATISSAPGGITKRPRSVDCGAERVPIPGTEPSSSSNNNAPTPGPSGSSLFSMTAPPASSSSKPTKPGKTRKSRSTVNDKHLSISASGLKPKSELLSSFDSSFDGEIPGPSSSSVLEKVGGISEAASCPHSSLSDLAAASAVVAPLPPRPIPPRAGDGNRSSVSSEGFCDNDNEGLEVLENDVLEAENLDEGVDTDPKVLPGPALAQCVSLNTTTSEEIDGDGEADNDADADSDSSIFTRSAAGVGVVEAAARKFDSSDSQQSGDEYQLYYYDPKASVGPHKKKSDSSSAEESSAAGGKKDGVGGGSVFSNLKRIEDDPWDVLFARAEGLHAHGHSKEACKLGVKLATDLLANPPKLSIELSSAPAGKGKRKKVNPISHQVSCLASTTLAKCGFLCTVLAENPDYFFLAFQIGMFGLELARPPASTKPLEVKLANQEAELALLLKRIPVGQRELEMMREKGDSLKNGSFKARGESLLPTVLANFIFDILVSPSNREGRCTLQPGVYHLPTDESLGFEAAVSALGIKANVSEADHPLLCEGTRRQRGDLALVMLLHYKDDSDKLAKIMDKLLDREIHQLYKAPLPPAYYSNNPPTAPLLMTNHSATGSATGRSTGGGDEGHPNREASPGGENTPATSSPVNSGAVAATSMPVSGGEVGVVAGDAVNSNSGSDSNGESPPEAGGPAAVPASVSVPTTATASSPPAPNAGGSNNQIQNQTTQTSASTMPTKSGRYKGKRAYPVLPNQPSEASAHFMFELAKIVLGKAGGSSNQSLFTQPSNNGQNPRGPHRALHM